MDDLADCDLCCTIGYMSMLLEERRGSDWWEQLKEQVAGGEPHYVVVSSSLRIPDRSLPGRPVGVSWLEFSPGQSSQLPDADLLAGLGCSSAALIQWDMTLKPSMALPMQLPEQVDGVDRLLMQALVVRQAGAVQLRCVRSGWLDVAGCGVGSTLLRVQPGISPELRSGSLDLMRGMDVFLQHVSWTFELPPQHIGPLGERIYLSVMPVAIQQLRVMRA